MTSYTKVASWDDRFVGVRDVIHQELLKQMPAEWRSGVPAGSKFNFEVRIEDHDDSTNTFSPQNGFISYVSRNGDDIHAVTHGLVHAWARGPHYPPPIIQEEP